MTFELAIKEIIDETHDTKTFRFDKPENMTFKPGDHTALEFPGEPDKRPFTFSSAPECDYVDITIKLNGGFTEKLFSSKVGDKMILSSPSGKGLEFDDSYNEPLLLIATGSGVTPLMSLVRHLEKRGIKRDVKIVYGNKTHADIIFKKEFEGLPENYELINVISREEADIKGRISEEVILKHIPDLKDRRWFMCGMPGFVKPMVEVARKHIPDEKIMAEIWFK